MMRTWIPLAGGPRFSESLETDECLHEGMPNRSVGMAEGDKIPFLEPPSPSAVGTRAGPASDSNPGNFTRPGRPALEGCERQLCPAGDAFPPSPRLMAECSCAAHSQRRRLYVRDPGRRNPAILSPGAAGILHDH